jgi:HicB family
MSIERKANLVLNEAKRLSKDVPTWADFSALLFDGFSGIVTKTFPDEMERQAFFDSKQYSEVNNLLIGLMKKHGVVDGSKRTEKSGKFVVRIPKSIHQNLEEEANHEGVSLNQLAATKLARPLTDRDEKSRAKALVARAFNSVHEGYSTDWIIIEPHRNRLFLEKCRQLGLEMGDFALNSLLLNIRKDSKNKGMLNPATKRSGFSSYDDCGFAAEIAIRTLQRTRGIALDTALCDPDMLKNFDVLAKKYAPNQTELKLRCAVLNLRKTHRLQPFDLDSEAYDLVSAGPVRRVSLKEIDELAGGYAFFDHKRPIFAGETDNLRRRIGIHLESGLPEWLEVKEDEGFELKTLILPSATKDDRLSWLGAFINREKPVLNYQKAA